MLKHLPCPALALALLLPATGVAGDGFRIDTDIYKGNEKTPIIETQTLFVGGQVYDFLLTKPIEITIYDPARAQITLLDVDQRLKTVITTMEILDHVFAIKEQSVEVNEPLFVFASDPKFETKVQPFTENQIPKMRLTLASPNFTYSAVGVKPKDADAVAAFRDFADWYARLNATRPGNLPPGARMALNRVLAEQGLLPTEVRRSTAHTIQGRQQTLEVTSKHLVNWEITGQDRQRIQEAHNMMAAYITVPYADFCLPPGKQPARQAKK
jgi:hypothetical protein